MSAHDRYEMDILKALQKIGRHLESIDRKIHELPIVNKTDTQSFSEGRSDDHE